jgi:hypothetical protein
MGEAGLPADGLYLEEDGSLMGRVTYVDAQSLTQVPLAGATVTFMQNREVKAQTSTDTNGIYKITGLSPGGVYSVFVTHTEYIAVFGTVVRSADDAPILPEETVAADSDEDVALVSRERLASLMLDNGLNSTQGASSGDFQSFFGDQQGTPFAGDVATGAVGGSGGGGAPGGGGGLGGLAALAGLAGLAGISGGDDGAVGSPSLPANQQQ